MTDIGSLRRALIYRVLDGEGAAARSDRRSAFENAEFAEPVRTLVQKVAMRPTTVTVSDIADARAFGLGEDQIFELATCAALGQATRQYEAAAAALQRAFRKV